MSLSAINCAVRNTIKLLTYLEENVGLRCMLYFYGLPSTNIAVFSKIVIFYLS